MRSSKERELLERNYDDFTALRHNRATNDDENDLYLRNLMLFMHNPMEMRRLLRRKVNSKPKIKGDVIMNPLVRYWIKMAKSGEPIETDDVSYIKYELKKPGVILITETIYPNHHQFKSRSSKGDVYHDMTDAERSDFVARMFNKSDQYERQIIRKKSKSKPKIK